MENKFDIKTKNVKNLRYKTNFFNIKYFYFISEKNGQLTKKFNSEIFFIMDKILYCIHNKIKLFTV